MNNHRYLCTFSILIRKKNTSHFHTHGSRGTSACTGTTFRSSWVAQWIHCWVYMCKYNIYICILYTAYVYMDCILLLLLLLLSLLLLLYIYINILSNYIIIYISYLFNIHMGVATANARKPLKGSYNFKPSVATGPFGPEITILQTCAGQLSITHLQKNTKELDPQINQ